jgi:hypothetical protein
MKKMIQAAFAAMLLAAAPTAVAGPLVPTPEEEFNIVLKVSNQIMMAIRTNDWEKVRELARNLAVTTPSAYWATMKVVGEQAVWEAARNIGISTGSMWFEKSRLVSFRLALITQELLDTGVLAPIRLAPFGITSPDIHDAVINRTIFLNPDIQRTQAMDGQSASYWTRQYWMQEYTQDTSGTGWGGFDWSWNDGTADDYYDFNEPNVNESDPETVWINSDPDGSYEWNTEPESDAGENWNWGGVAGCYPPYPKPFPGDTVYDLGASAPAEAADLVLKYSFQQLADEARNSGYGEEIIKETQDALMLAAGVPYDLALQSPNSTLVIGMDDLLVYPFEVIDQHGFKDIHWVLQYDGFRVVMASTYHAWCRP